MPARLAFRAAGVRAPGEPVIGQVQVHPGERVRSYPGGSEGQILVHQRIAQARRASPRAHQARSERARPSHPDLPGRCRHRQTPPIPAPARGRRADHLHMAKDRVRAPQLTNLLSSSEIRVASALVVPGSSPASTRSRWTQLRSVSPLMPSCSPTRRQALETRHVRLVRDPVTHQPHGSLAKLIGDTSSVQA